MSVCYRRTTKKRFLDSGNNGIGEQKDSEAVQKRTPQQILGYKRMYRGIEASTLTRPIAPKGPGSEPVGDEPNIPDTSRRGVGQQGQC